MYIHIHTYIYMAMYFYTCVRVASSGHGTEQDIDKMLSGAKLRHEWTSTERGCHKVNCWKLMGCGPHRAVLVNVYIYTYIYIHIYIYIMYI